jgi:hypothetical protein
MTRSLFCILLLAIIGLTRIALADAQDARKTLHVAFKRAIEDMVKKGERDPYIIADFAMARTQTERQQFFIARVMEGVRLGLRRSEAEENATAEIKDMLDGLLESILPSAEISSSKMSRQT